MIDQYESSPKDYFLYAPRQYGLGQEHKHLPEVQHVCGLSEAQFLCQLLMITIWNGGYRGIHSRLCHKPVCIDKVQQTLEYF